MAPGVQPRAWRAWTLLYAGNMTRSARRPLRWAVLAILSGTSCVGAPRAPRLDREPSRTIHAPTADAGEGPRGTEALARAYRERAGPVAPISDTTVVAEAEEFRVESPGWRARPFGTNYFAATFANCFLSRQAYLGAPEQSPRTSATIEVQIPKAGSYLALARYEAAYRFETIFRLVVEQGGTRRLDRVYGARDNTKVWAFRQELQKEVSWEWGASDSIVWEGHDAAVDLDAGVARLTLIADGQPEPAARRNVDLVMLTSDKEQVKTRIATEGHLPLDGMLTQAGDVFVRVHNRAGGPQVTLTVPNGIEHSPFWSHLRDWKPKTIRAEPGHSTGWHEVGSLLDTLSDGQWRLTAEATGDARTPPAEPVFDIEVGVRAASGGIESIRRFSGVGKSIELVYFGDTRWSRRVGLADDVLHDLVAWLEAHPARGVAPRRTPVFGITFDAHPDDGRYQAAVMRFADLMGATGLGQGDFGTLGVAAGRPTGDIDVRGVETPRLEQHLAETKASGKHGQIAVVSLGDEIALATPPAGDHAGFRAWLRQRGVTSTDLGVDISAAKYLPDATSATPGVRYYSRQYAYRHGIRQLKARTDIVRRVLPGAGVGANYSPHQGHMYLGDTHQWISLFREGGMTMPWGEDYIFQVPVGSPQVNFLMVDMLRAALRGTTDGKIHYYVMAHAPGNTPRAWRRQFYGDLAHGVKVLNLFELRPRQVAYTENHVTGNEMYQAVREALHELGTFEDMIQDGHTRPGVGALWFSEAADVWDDNSAPFDAHKRSLYLAIRHAEMPLDVVVEGDPLGDYRVIYLADRHVSRAASRALAEWVQAGGRLVATAGAGMKDELDQPNRVLRDLFGVEPAELVLDKENVVRLEKQDLPFATAMDHVTSDGTSVPVLGARTRFTTTGTVLGRFDDGSPATAARAVGKGWVSYLGYLPGLAYLQPAFPRRPTDRGTTDASMNHFLPTVFDAAAAEPLRFPDIPRPVSCSRPLVESTIVDSRHGVLIPLVNWTTAPLTNLAVTVRVPVPTRHVALASGGPVRVTTERGATIFHLDLDVADALILGDGPGAQSTWK